MKTNPCWPKGFLAVAPFASATSRRILMLLATTGAYTSRTSEFTVADGTCRSPYLIPTNVPTLLKIIFHISLHLSVLKLKSITTETDRVGLADAFSSVLLLLASMGLSCETINFLSSVIPETIRPR